jgi:ATP-dependent exoDNAse (exonuclease V) beta subunit
VNENQSPITSNQSPENMNFKIISAGAGSGKTYRLTEEMVALLNPDNPNRVRANGIAFAFFGFSRMLV